MPGTIQVSVLEFVDPPSSPSSSSSFEARNSDMLSLKVAMGKREYQSLAKEDLSFPVMSLCENLIMTLHDAEGNEISRTDVETLLVVEKGSRDTFFQLEGGGYVHLKLQFLLSEEERKRIRELRESVLKRKHEQLKHGLRRSVSDESGSPLVAPLSQKLQEHSGHSSEQDVSHLARVNKPILDTQLSRKDICEIQDSTEDPQLGCRSFISGNVSATSNSASTRSKEYRAHSPKKSVLEKNPDRNVKRMISAFENSLFQGIRHHVGPMTKFQLRKIEIKGSLRGAWSEETNTKNIKVGQTIAKSFSSGMLSEMSLQQTPEHKNLLQVKKLEERKDTDLAINRETMRKKPGVELKKNRNFTNLYEGTNDVAEPVKTKEVGSLDGSAENVGERHEPLLRSKHNSVFEINKRRDSAVKNNIVSGHRPTFDGVHADEIGNNEGDFLGESCCSRADESAILEQPCSLSTHQQQFVLNVVGEDSGGRSSRDDSDETACGISNSNLDLVTYVDIEQWLLGSPGSWKPRHLCITTGSKQLRDLIKGFGVQVESRPMRKKLTRMKSNEELIIYGGICTEAIEGEKISCCSRHSNTESFVDISKINGGLIEQAVRVVILVVACGTLLLNTRQRKPRLL